MNSYNPAYMQVAFHPETDRMDAAIRTLTTILPCPPHQPNLVSVAQSAATCITEAIDLAPEFRTLAVPFVEDLQWLVNGIQESGQGDTSEATLLGLATKFPGWCCLAKLDTSSEQLVSARQLLGLELCLGVAARKAVAPSAIATMNRRLRADTSPSTLQDSKDEQKIPRAIDRLSKLAKALKPCLASSQHSPALVELNLLVNSSISASLSSLRGKERKAAGADSALSPHDTNRAIARLLQASKDGDSQALASQLAFCVGLPWHISQPIPFTLGDRPPGALVWIDVRKGLVYVDLGPAFSAIPAQGDRRHIQSTFLLCRPLPLETANQLMEAVAANTSLKTLGDLASPAKAGKSKLNLEGLHHSASLARLISAAGPIALDACNRRDLAAFATLSFELINKSDLHYVTIKQHDIWDVCSKLFNVAGLGAPVPCPDDIRRQSVGSNLTPQRQWIEDVFEEAKAAVAGARCGRRYTLSSVVVHHNAYARYVGLMLQIGLGGRNRKTINFTAEMVNSDNDFALVVENKLSKTMGQTPIPMPAVVADQIALWKAHLTALARRLKKLDAKGSDKVAILVGNILLDQNVPLLFTLTANGSPKPLRNEDLLQGQAKNLTGDFGRHLGPDELMALGLPFEDAQDWLRHDTQGVSHHDVFSDHVKYLYLQRTAAALNKMLLQLNICAIPGLCKGGA